MIMIVVNIAQLGALFGLGGSDEDDGPGFLEIMLLAILGPLAAGLIQAAISRSREFQADASGAQLTGDPLALASALRKIESGVAARPAGSYRPGGPGQLDDDRQPVRRRRRDPPVLHPPADRRARGPAGGDDPHPAAVTGPAGPVLAAAPTAVTGVSDAGRHRRGPRPAPVVGHASTAIGPVLSGMLRVAVPDVRYAPTPTARPTPGETAAEAGG